MLGRIGSGDVALPFLIGAGKQVTIPIAGRLFLGINHPANATAEGSFTVKLNRVKSAPKDAATFSGKLPALDASYFDRIPRRVSDPQGTPGDRINFAIVGSEDQMKAALKTAGWVIADRDVNDTILKGVIATFSKQAYLTLPMSMLQLFGRNQDYGFAHAEPIAVVTQRHHFRLWKSPNDVDGSTVWIGAGTHDIGFDRDERNNGLTHKIDPDTDKERDFIVESLKQTGVVVKTDNITPKDHRHEGENRPRRRVLQRRTHRHHLAAARGVRDRRGCFRVEMIEAGADLPVQAGASSESCGGPSTRMARSRRRTALRPPGAFDTCRASNPWAF